MGYFDKSSDLQTVFTNYIDSIQDLILDIQELINDANEHLKIISKETACKPMRIMNPLFHDGKEFEFSSIFELEEIDFVKFIAEREDFCCFNISFSFENRKILMAEFFDSNHETIVGFLSGKDSNGILDKLIR